MARCAVEEQRVVSALATENWGALIHVLSTLPPEKRRKLTSALESLPCRCTKADIDAAVNLDGAGGRAGARRHCLLTDVVASILTSVRWWEFGQLSAVSHQMMERVTTFHATRLCLDVSGTGVTDGWMMGVLPHCMKLRLLDLSHCPLLTDRVLCAVSVHCRSLRDLSLVGNAIFSPQGLAFVAESCPHLESLDISECTSLLRSGPHSLPPATCTSLALRKHCSHLKTLKVSCYVPPAIGFLECQELREFHFSQSGYPLERAWQRCHVQAFKCVIKMCARLSHVSFDLWDISGALLRAIAEHCKGLRHLGIQLLEPGEAGAELIEVAENCKDLQFLDVAGLANADDVLVRLVPHCGTLHEFCFFGCEPISDAGLIQIGLHCTELRRLGIIVGECTAVGAQAVATRCSHLTALKFESHGLDMENYTLSPFLQAFTENCPALTDLEMSWPVPMGDPALSVVAKCFGLKELVISGQRVTDNGVCDIAQSCPFLRRLDISMCGEITDAALESLALHCADIRILSCSRRVGTAPRLTDRGVEAIARGCRQLSSLDLEGCEGVSDSTLHTLATRCFELRELDVRECPLLTDTGLAAVMWSCRRLRSLCAPDFPQVSRALHAQLALLNQFGGRSALKRMGRGSFGELNAYAAAL